MNQPKLDAEEKMGKRRSYSLSSLQSEDNFINDLKMNKKSFFHRTYSDSSVEFYLHSDTEEYKALDSGICDRIPDGDMLIVLEQKIDRLSDMFAEQCRLLNTMKDEIRGSKMLITKTEQTHDIIFVDMLKKCVSQREKDDDAARSVEEEGETNIRGRILLNAIESGKVSIDTEIRDSLVGFLQSEELKDEMVRAIAESVRGMIGGCFSRDMSSLYLPILERSHRRLVEHINKVLHAAFLQLEDESSNLMKTVSKTSGVLRNALERHQRLLDATSNPGKNLVNTLQITVEELLQNELKGWRQKILDIFSSHMQREVLTNSVVVPPAAIDYDMTVSSPQPPKPGISAIDQLMNAALINKQIESGKVNDAFESALSAADLSLVMVACRAADPAKMFASQCLLKQHVLLSLIQQLATDMLHETQLKCRYLEEAIIKLNPSEAETRSHLPLVVGEVRKHLSKFLTAYPNHAASRRITLIIMAASNLLK